jgi:hypothetical protein
MAILQHDWNLPLSPMDGSKTISAKFKNLRRVLKVWKALLPNLDSTIANCREIIQFLDIVEEFRDLTLEEC